MNHAYSYEPTEATIPYKKGDVLIQVLCKKSVAMWYVSDVENESKLVLQLIDDEGKFTTRTKVVSGNAALSNFVKDGLATRLLNLHKSKRER